MPAPLHFTDALRDSSNRVAAWPDLALLGQPVGHSRSPLLHDAALRASGRDGHYGLVEVAPEDLLGSLRSARDGGLRGANLTSPLKEVGLSAADRVSAEAGEIGAANTLVLRDGEWIAHNTDARGLAMALERLAAGRLPPLLKHVAVLGSGGAARAAVHALRALGVRRLEVAARRVEAAKWAEDQGASTCALSALSLRSLTLLVQCTSLGWNRDDPLPVDLEGADSQLHLFDTVYVEGGSALLRGARAQGLRAEGGETMLVAQAALAFSMWFGGLPPVEVMAHALGFAWKQS